MPYQAPIDEYKFLLDHVVGFDQVSKTPRFNESTQDMVEAILAEAGRMCQDVLAPLQRVGDTDPARMENGRIRTSAGFNEGYKAIAEGGWVSMAASPE